MIQAQDREVERRQCFFTFSLVDPLNSITRGSTSDVLATEAHVRQLFIWHKPYGLGSSCNCPRPPSSSSVKCKHSCLLLKVRVQPHVEYKTSRYRDWHVVDIQ